MVACRQELYRFKKAFQVLWDEKITERGDSLKRLVLIWLTTLTSNGNVVELRITVFPPSTGWNHDEIHAAVWKCDVDMEWWRLLTKTILGTEVCVGVCVPVCADEYAVLSAPLIFWSHRRFTHLPNHVSACQPACSWTDQTKDPNSCRHDQLRDHWTASHAGGRWTGAVPDWFFFSVWFSASKSTEIIMLLWVCDTPDGSKLTPSF